MRSLEELIAQEIRREGPITFARFMELALYHHELGYYSGSGLGREPIGWSGDYFTSGDLHPLWGWTIARQLHQMWQLLGSPSRFDIVEPGAGRGLLAADVWRFALQQAAPWAESLRYTVVDRAAPDGALRQRRQERLDSELQRLHAPKHAVHIVDSPPDLPHGIVGCVVSNEVVDALPTHILEKHEGRLAEVYVSYEPGDGRPIFFELLGNPSSDEVASYLDKFAVPWLDFPDRWRCEVCPEAAAVYGELATRVERGYLLTIDYGAEASELYTPLRFRGTLAAYRQHQMQEQPLARPGHQDLTAHVNFSALIAAGHTFGLETVGITRQAEFLSQLGIQKEAQTLASRLYPYADSERHTDRGQADYLRRRSLLAAVSLLQDPGGLGAFLVLAQQRGTLPDGGNLLGFQPG